MVSPNIYGVLPQKVGHSDVAFPQQGRWGESKLDLLQGTLDLMVLQTLAVMGALHGYGIARRIEQISGNQSLAEPGNHLRLPHATAAARVDFSGLGRF